MAPKEKTWLIERFEAEFGFQRFFLESLMEWGASIIVGFFLPLCRSVTWEWLVGSKLLAGGIPQILLRSLRDFSAAMVAGSLVQKGDFIEETLGIAEREDIMKNGFLLCIPVELWDVSDERSPIVVSIKTKHGQKEFNDQDADVCKRITCAIICGVFWVAYHCMISTWLNSSRHSVSIGWSKPIPLMAGLYLLYILLSTLKTEPVWTSSRPPFILWKNLGGGFKYFYVHHENWGRFQFWPIFFAGWVETTNYREYIMPQAWCDDWLEANHPLAVIVWGWLLAMEFSAVKVALNQEKLDDVGYLDVSNIQWNIPTVHGDSSALPFLFPNSQSFQLISVLQLICSQQRTLNLKLHSFP